METTIFLQTGQVGISQDAHQIIYKFPETREELFQFDVILAFDLDWRSIPEDSRSLLRDWVDGEGGGIVFIAGDVNSPQTAAANEGLEKIHELLPVILDEVGLRLGSRDRSPNPWKVGLTDEGKAAAFLQLVDDPTAASKVWEDFPGLYRCYPTRGKKGGATVYAEFTDPLSRGGSGQPILIAGQRYGQGSVLYLGSPETFRLRAQREDYFERLWVKMVRKVSEGRSKRGLQRGMIILEGRDYDIGQTVPVRARVQSAQFQPLDVDTIPIEVYDPTGRPMIPSPVLTRDRHRPSEYTGDFRVILPGRYRLEVAIPDSTEKAVAEVQAAFSPLEAIQLQQDAKSLKALVEGTGGTYMTIDTVATELPAKLPNMGQTIVIAQRLKELWDRSWVLYALIAVLGLEWLTRKLLKLA